MVRKSPKSGGGLKLLAKRNSVLATTSRAVWSVLCLTAAVAGCGLGESGPTAPEASLRTVATAAAVDPSSRDPPGIHNLQRVSQRIYSGSEPDGELGFASLKKLGVRTVVSVDGSKPDVALAHQHGLRYVHIPFGYDGIPPEAGQALARLVREAQQPFYIHCHHGQHRGPAAAAVACIAAGELSGRDPQQILVRAGTSRDYAGLWRDVAAYRPPPRNSKLPELVETAAVSSLAAAMAQIDHSVDDLKLCRDAGWAVPAAHPDLLPAQEALLVREDLHEAARNLSSHYDPRFRSWLAEAEACASQLEAALTDNDIHAATERSVLLEQACQRCHAEYRN